MSKYTEEQEDIQFLEPIVAQKAVRIEVQFAEKDTWKVKEKEKWTPEQRSSMQEYLDKEYDACKLTLLITDDSVATEHEDAKPRLTIENQFNIEKYPFPDKKTGKLRWLGRQNLYQLEQAFGFDPVFKVNNEVVEPFITKSGNKIAPKVDGVKRVLNEDFFNAYFTNEGEPIKDNWIGKVIYADIDLDKSEQFGNRNVIKKYVKAPAV